MIDERIAARLVMSEVMNTYGPSKTPRLLLAMAFVSAPLACDTQAKQIGQLDDEAETSSDVGDEPGDSAACVAALESLQAAFGEQQGQRCALVMLLDYETYEPSGWNLQCAAGDLGMSVDEAEALTTWGGQDFSEPEDGEPDDRSFMFYASPNESPENTGGVGWVSNQAGLLFDASIVAGGIGEIHHPSTWRDPSELGSGCVPPGGAFEWWGYDLTEEPVVYNVPHAQELWTALIDTAVLRAVVLDREPGSFTLDALAYPRTMAEFEPSSAEYVLVFEWAR